MLIDRIAASDKERYEQGHQEGRHEGVQETQQVIAQRMLHKGFPLEDVLEVTGLSREVLRAYCMEIRPD